MCTRHVKKLLLLVGCLGTLSGAAYPYELKLGQAESASGGQVKVPLSVSSDVPVKAVQVVFDWPQSAGMGIDFEVDPAIVALADFIVGPNVQPGWMTIGIVSFSSPITGNDVHLGDAVIQCAGSPDPAPPVVHFADGVYQVAEGSPLLSNVLTVGGFGTPIPLTTIDASNGLVLYDGGFECEYFVRGNVNQDRRVDISDAATIFRCLFPISVWDPEACLACMDAADVNDNGGVTIADGIYLLNFLFRGGPAIPPPSPFPTVFPTSDPGLDPTADSIYCPSYFWNP
jgi:hypothetical protein